MSRKGSDDYEPDAERVQESAVERRHERTETVEDMIGDAGFFEEAKYPATSEELAAEYADETIDLKNETESIGSVFDRLTDGRFESPDDAREAIINELTGDEGGAEEYNDQRPLSGFDEEDERLE